VQLGADKDFFTRRFILSELYLLPPLGGAMVGGDRDFSSDDDSDSDDESLFSQSASR